MTAVAIIHKELIIEQIATGAMLKTVAAEVGVTPGAISNALHNDPDYRRAREVGANARLEEKYMEIEDATAMTDIARAREGFRAAAWFAEREFPHRWGAKQQIEHIGAVHVEHVLRLDAGSIIDGIVSTDDSGATIGATVIDGKCNVVDNQ